MKVSLLAAILSTALLGCSGMEQITQTGLNISQALGYSPTQLNTAVKEVLTISSQRTSEILGQDGGYSANSLFKITLPDQFDPIIEPARALGFGKYIDTIEALMNQGAEQAAKEAAPIFMSAINSMSIDDALGIVRGGDAAATHYFQAKSESALRTKYQMIMESQLQQLGFYSNYKSLVNGIALLPIANKPNLDLEDYAIDKGMNALFSQIAMEEAKIRANPIEAGSTLLSAVFSQ